MSGRLHLDSKHGLFKHLMPHGFILFTIVHAKRQNLTISKVLYHRFFGIILHVDIFTTITNSLS